MMEPLAIEDEEHEQVVAWVAAAGVAKGLGRGVHEGAAPVAAGEAAHHGAGGQGDGRRGP
jgi:hypothetical protein